MSDIRLYMKDTDFSGDERFRVIIDELLEQGAKTPTILELVESIVRVSNSHIWGTLMLIEQGKD